VAVETLERTTYTETHAPVLRALRDLGGRVTVGDVAAATGLGHDEAQARLRELLAGYRGHLAVGEAGDLVFHFDPALLRRDRESRWTRFKRSAKRFLAGAFKAWIVTMLVVYFVVFVALVVAALVASVSGDRRDSRRSRGMRIPTWWIWYLFWTRGWHPGGAYYGHRWEQRQPGVRVPFYKKVFAFVFGPDAPRLTQAQRDRSVLALIRARRGVLSTAELVAHTGLTQEQATEELGRLMGAHAGDVRVTDAGDLLYGFPELMVSARGRVREAEPLPAWKRLEPALEVTGNTSGTDVLVAGLNGFNLIAAASAPLTFMPRLGLSGALVTTGLVWVPLTFSALFFAVHLLRRAAVTRENAARRNRNLRKVLVGRVFAASLEQKPLLVSETARAMRNALDDKSIGDHVVADALGLLATEYEAEVHPGASGEVEFRLPRVRRELQAAEELRARLALEQQTVGEVVFDTEDSPAAESRRDLAAFDAELRRRLRSADSPAYAEAWADEETPEPVVSRR
jgi:hypothetical protein